MTARQLIEISDRIITGFRDLGPLALAGIPEEVDKLHEQKIPIFAFLCQVLSNFFYLSFRERMEVIDRSESHSIEQITLR